MYKKYAIFSIAAALFVTACLCTSLNLTSTPEPTSTEAATLPFFDDFSVNAYGWPIDFDNGDYADTTYAIDHGVYKWTVYAHQNAYSIAWPNLPLLTDFTVAVEAKQIDDNLDDSDYGIIYRSGDGQEYYSFAISNTLFSVYFYNKSSGWEEIIPWQSSSDIRAGDVNVLKVVSSNGIIAFYANDTLLIQFSNDRLTEGRPGLGVDVYTAGETGTFEFDNFSVTTP